MLNLVGMASLQGGRGEGLSARPRRLVGPVARQQEVAKLEKRSGPGS